jgi:hypothetical protein
MVDIVFLVIFSLTLLILTFATFKSLKHKEHRDIYNLLTVLFIYMTLLSNHNILLIFIHVTNSSSFLHDNNACATV